MFYAHFVLSKKGPLARIWLAAHWDKKLTKAHVFETNVESSVESIIHPKVKMALRTSGHLLLGVVRIHSRKAKYLLADCNEAFVKIKMAFRPGVVDLPEDNREAAFTAITLPEVFHDFDAPVPDYNDIDIQKQFTMNQSRVEEITMKEDFGNITLAGHDDGFGDIPFDDREVLREGSNMEESLYKPSADESNLLLTSEKKDSNIDSSLEKPMDLVGYDKPLEDDGFGGGMGMGMGDGILGDGFLGEPNLFEEQPEITTEVSIGSDTSEKKDEDEVKEGEMKAVETPQEETPGEAPTAVAVPATPAPPVDQTTLVHNEAEAFALEPIDVTGMKETRHRRKRKLVVDDVKELSGDIIKAQLKDTTDITTTLDLAPPTKKLMIWKETGGVDKLFALTGRVAGCCLLKIFTRNLTTQKLTAKQGETEQEEEKMEVDEPEIPRQEKEIPREVISTVETHVPEQDSTLQVNESTHQEANESSVAPVQNLPMMSPIARPDTPSSDGDGDMGDDDLFGPGSVQSFGVEPASDSDDDAPQMPDSPDMSQDESDEDDDDDVSEDKEEKRWNKRTQQMIHVLQKQLQKQDEITFNELSKKNNRKQAASKFYTFLVLKKQNAINVQQSEPFGEILISRGPQFDTIL
ncbi:double-strand-break repair protein rad21 homolog [Glandiceps talaboti]